MIMDAFISISTFLLSGIVSLFPASSGLPSEVGDAFAYFGGHLAILDPLVPIATLGTCVGILLSVELLLFGFKILRWILSHVPFVGGKG
jgi:hypothetical protein